MGNALQDQLLKAGLVDKKQANRAHKAKQKNEKLNRKGQPVKEDQARLNAQKAKEKQANKDRTLNLEREEAAAKKALEAQIKQLIEMNRLEAWQGDIAYSFTDGGKVKRIHVGEDIHRQLGAGRLAIARWGDRYEPIPSGVADKIALRDPKKVIINSTPDPISEEDDPYADFKVPDDLMW